MLINGAAGTTGQGHRGPEPIRYVRTDLYEVPLREVDEAWTADHGRSRVVFTL